MPLKDEWDQRIIAKQDKFTPQMLLAELQEQDITVSFFDTDRLHTQHQYCYPPAMATAGCKVVLTLIAGGHGDRPN